MTQRQLERWKVTRAKGRGRYIWLTGVLVWGVATGVLWSVTMSAIKGWSQFPIFLPIALIVYPIGGYYFGSWTWKKAEDDYQKSIEHRTPT